MNHCDNGRRNTVCSLSAHLVANEDATAANIVEQALAKAPGDTNLVWAATQAYMGYAARTNAAARYGQAIAVIDQQLNLLPNKSEALLNKGWFLIQMGKFQEAIGPLNRVLETVNLSTELAQCARLNRAIALLQLGQLAEAQKDYIELRGHTNSFPVLTVWRIANATRTPSPRWIITNAISMRCRMLQAG
jgi:tetratricopeptide (TPR) repeat protein